MISITTVVFILFLLTFATLILVRHNNNSLSAYCDNDKDCPQGYKCINNPELENKKQCFPSKAEFCSLQPDKLKECDPNNPNSCNDCLNEPSFSCIVVDDKHPYVWRQGDKTINVPNSPPSKGWCLPDVKTDNYCNPYTSDYVLIETSPERYEWGCLCKYPNLFTSTEPGGDCNVVRACGQEDNDKNNLFVPNINKKECKTDNDCENDEKCLTIRDPPPCGTTSTKKVCHTMWSKDQQTQHNINPLSGQCVCDVGLKYQCLETGENVYKMNCIPDSCGVFGSTTDCEPIFGNCVQTPATSCCNCPKGYIKCPEDIPATNTAVCVTCLNQPKCIPDPCAPLGHFDRDTQRCVCTAPNSAPQADEDSAVGEICVDLCRDNGPCGSGGQTRGSCYVKDDGSGRLEAKCCSCVSPYGQDPTGLCVDTAGNGLVTYCNSQADCETGKCTWIRSMSKNVCACGGDGDCYWNAPAGSCVWIGGEFPKNIKKCLRFDKCNK